MIIYYSGKGHPASDAETLLNGGNVMLAFWSIREETQQAKRFGVIVEKRQTRVGHVQSHFLDSGAFTLWTKAAKWAEENGKERWDYYDTDEFWQYMDDYAKFVKKYKVAIDFYANVDVIPNPELTWRNQRYLEREHGLNPVPVVHYTTDLKWLRRYIDKGYDLIGIGGLVGRAKGSLCRDWMDEVFNMVCDTPDRLPMVKLHGFGVTSYPLLIRYPWWSVDSVSWAKIGGFGNILVPHKRGGKFDFSEAPYVMSMSMESPKQKTKGIHYTSLSSREQRILREWLEVIGIPLGRVEGKEVVEHGVLTRHTERRAANLLFFEKLREWLPEWPWPFKQRPKQNFGFV